MPEIPEWDYGGGGGPTISGYTSPDLAPSGARLITRIPLPAGTNGWFGPGDYIGRAGISGEGGFGVKILRVAAGVAVLAAAVAEVKDATTQKVHKKPCRQPIFSGGIQHVMFTNRDVLRRPREALALIVLSAPTKWEAIVANATVTSTSGGVNESFVFAGQTTQGEMGWSAGAVGQGDEATWLTSLALGPGLGFSIELTVDVVWPAVDDYGHKVCDTTPQKLRFPPFIYEGSLTVLSVAGHGIP